MAEMMSHDGTAGLFDVRVTKDVSYGIGIVKATERPISAETRKLLLDVYEPVAVEAGAKRPALVLAFGGAFHRGSKNDDTFEDGEWRNTPISEYCHAIASRGFVCFSVDYRLTSEDPDPGPNRWLTAPEALARSRMDHVRGLLGLPPATNEILANGMEAAFNDVTAAFNYVVENAAQYDIDESRVAIGGFSAGGTSALYAVYACGVPAAAVVTLSGRMEAADIKHYIRGPHATPILQVLGEHDLEYVRELTKELAEHCGKDGVQHHIVHVPSAGHFYPRQAKVVANDGPASTVGQAVIDFLETSLCNSGLATPR